MTELQKVNFALNGIYHELNPMTGKQEQTRLGLGKKGREILEAIDQGSLKEKEQLAYLIARFELLIDLGHVGVLADDLKNKNVREILPPDYMAQCQLQVAGALGDYEKMDQSLRDLEKITRANMPLRRKQLNQTAAFCLLQVFHSVAQPSAAPLAFDVRQMAFGSITRDLNQALLEWYKIHNNLFNTMSLRASVALEAGDTKKARAILAATLAEAGSEHFFSERVLARRYLELLTEQGH